MIAMPKNRPSSIWVSCDIFHTSFCSVLTSYASNMGDAFAKPLLQGCERSDKIMTRGIIAKIDT